MGCGIGQSRLLTGGGYTERDTDPVPPEWHESGRRRVTRVLWEKLPGIRQGLKGLREWTASP